MITAVAMFTGVLASGAWPGPAQAVEGYARAGRSFPALTDQIIVRLPSVSRLGLNRDHLNSLSVTAGEALRVVRSMSGHALVLKLPAFRELPEVAAIADRLRGEMGVMDAEPDVMVFPQQQIPNDPLYLGGDLSFPDYQQWHYFDPAGCPDNAPCGINLPSAWNIATGFPDVAVAVIDTGVTPHRDLVERFLPGYDFISMAAIANDGDGRDADASDPGNFVTSAESTDPTSPWYGCRVRNSSWHGTHVAGTVGAVSNNGIGVAGVTWDVGILPVRVMGKCGGYTSDVIDGMRWAAGLDDADLPPKPALPAKVLNLSLGGWDACGKAWQDTIDDVVEAGVTVVVAAGNYNFDVNPDPVAGTAGVQPASCAKVVTVAATDRSGNRASFSNYGSAVAISAPGSNILSTLNTGTQDPVADTYGLKSGTSMAAPHVAGVAALLYSLNPTLSPAQVTQFLQQNARDFPAGSTCYDPVKTCGAGIVDAGAALSALNDAMPHVSITPANGSTFTQGQTITFTGKVSDSQGRLLSNDTASLTWSSSPNGASGKGGSFTPTLSSVGTYTITAQVTNSAGLNGSAAISVTVIPPPTTVTLVSISAEDGWVLESSQGSTVGGSVKVTDTSSKGLLVGDDSRNRQYKSLLSFDTSALPDNATILSAQLRAPFGTVSGSNPFTTHGALLADVKTGYFGGSNLDKDDFQAAATAVGVASLSSMAKVGSWSEGVLNPAGLAAINKTGRTQFRLYFTLAHNNDRGTDYDGYYAGDSKTVAVRPQLVVTYR